MAQSWEKVTARQAANYNKKYNYQTFKQGITKKRLVNTSRLLEISQIYKIGQNK